MINRMEKHDTSESRFSCQLRNFIQGCVFSKVDRAICRSNCRDGAQIF